MKTISKNRGLAIVETLLIVAIIIVIIVLLAQRGRSSGYFMNGYRTTNTSTNSMGQTVEIPNTSSTTYTTTTTTTNGGFITNTNGKPVITLYGDNPYNINHPGIIHTCEGDCPPQTDFYSEPGYKAIDKEDGDITSKVKIVDDISKIRDNGPCHSYNKRYIVSDSSGNTATAIRVINECNGI